LADVAKEEAPEILDVGGREVRVTHPGKLYFSREAKLTKLDLVRYYLSVAEGALSGIRDRPIVLKRFVDGAEGDAFYQKRAPSSRPEWLRTVTLSFPSGRTAEEVAPARSITPTSSASTSIPARASRGRTSAASRSR
jgi:bifunctional non-homologous end joining protein LigD